MKSFISFIVVTLFVPLFSAQYLYAEETPTSAQSGSTESSKSVLLVDSIEPLDTHHIDISFNQDVIRESVRVRVTRQSDESNVRIETFTGGEDARTVSIVLAEPLIVGTAYKMTIVSAISDLGIIIKDGADGIKEFTTPESLRQGDLTFNAPTNPNAAKVTSGEATKSGSMNNTLPSGSGGVKAVTPEAKELPLSGMSSTLLIVLAGMLALVVLARRRSA